MISEVCLLYICMPKVQWEDHFSKKISTWINITSYRRPGALYYQGPGDGSVTLATKLEMFFYVSCHVVSMYKILLSLTE